MADPLKPELIVAICGLIESQLDLPPKRVYVYNSKWEIPKDDGLFVSVGYLGERPFGVSMHFENHPDDESEMIEVQTMNTQEHYSIDVFSRNTSARERKHEVIFALNSTEAERLCEQYSFKFGNLPTSFVDVSSVEASARLNRYSISFNLLRAHERRRAIESYNSFTGSPSLVINP
jgi:hypothetical protein